MGPIFNIMWNRLININWRQLLVEKFMSKLCIPNCVKNNLYINLINTSSFLLNRNINTEQSNSESQI